MQRNFNDGVRILWGTVTPFDFNDPNKLGQTTGKGGKVGEDAADAKAKPKPIGAKDLHVAPEATPTTGAAPLTPNPG